MSDFDDLDGNDRRNRQQQQQTESMVVHAMATAEINQQVSTAKAYPMHTSPKDIDRFQGLVQKLATKSPEIAAECFYRLKRGKKGSGGDAEQTSIVGPSVRFAEIVASCWGNIRIASRIIEETDRFVIAQGVVHDLETNLQWSSEIRQPITYKGGGKYNSDLVALHSNVACSKAARNALFRAVPRAYWSDIHEQVMKAAEGDLKALAERRDKAMAHFAKMGVTDAELFAWLSDSTRTVRSKQEIDAAMVADLKSLATAIRDGETSIDEEFRSKPEAEVKERQPSAPPESKVEEREALGPSEPPPEATPAPAKTKRGKKDEPAQAAAAAEPPPKAEPQPPKSPAVEDVTPPASNAPPAAAELPAIDSSTPVLFGFDWDPLDGHAVGTLRVNGTDGFQRWSGSKWLDVDLDKHGDAAYARATSAATVRITQHAKRSRMDKDTLYATVAETLQLKKPPAQLSELSLEQLVMFMRKSESQ